jgi:hypothetical protein
MRIRVLAVTALLMCGSFGAARAEDAPAPPPASAAPAVLQPDAQSSAPKQSLEKAPADSKAEKINEQASTRFSLRRVDGGFLRFDAQTGHVAFCNSHDSGWSCEAVPENRASLEKEIERLRGEVTELKQQLKAQEEPPRPPQPIPSPSQTMPIPSPPQTVPPTAIPPSSGNGGDMTDLPGREQISRAAAALQDAWHRFVELMNGLKNDMLRKSS